MPDQSTPEIKTLFESAALYVYKGDEDIVPFSVAIQAVRDTEKRVRPDERERLSARVYENGWCPTCARDTDEAAMQRLAGKSLESLSRTDLIGLALRNLNAAMDSEARAGSARREAFREAVEACERAGRTVGSGAEAARMLRSAFLSPDNPEGNA